MQKRTLHDVTVKIITPNLINTAKKKSFSLLYNALNKYIFPLELFCLRARAEDGKSVLEQKNRKSQTSMRKQSKEKTNKKKEEEEAEKDSK